MTRYKYKITYFNPNDKEGRKEKTWRFKTLKEAKAQQEDLKIVWNLADDELPKIERTKPIRCKKCGYDGGFIVSVARISTLTLSQTSEGEPTIEDDDDQANEVIDRPSCENCGSTAITNVKNIYDFFGDKPPRRRKRKK